MNPSGGHNSSLDDVDPFLGQLRHRSVEVDGTRAENNHSFGITINGSGTTATVRGCQSSGNGNTGIDANPGTEVNIESSVASNNGGSWPSTVSHGINAGGGTVRVSNSTVTNNDGYGFYNLFISGSFQSRGNNTVAGNKGVGTGDQTFGTITVITAN